MDHHDRPCNPRGQRAGTIRLLTLLAPLGLAACSGQNNVVMPWDAFRSTPAAAAPAPVAATPARPADSLAAFAGRAAPGQQESVTLPDSGRAAVVRLVRAYSAASGRECRELQIGGAAEGRGALYCQDPVAGWVPARPLLRGGALGRS
ncbi:hypothetical protein LPC08_22215 [Roseomonas sp. OT10]|uniref:DVU3141 family protein n=1 Tax=Roseomonas cutis TaxID=2897332 RepID=UPI001E58578A|nr:DVU3141 family protein [Roseomonas sp. OT10]UFN48694.1 hypothetical protein LPC08_22215 [Roseomonas sp. OT10]